MSIRLPSFYRSSVIPLALCFCACSAISTGRGERPDAAQDTAFDAAPEADLPATGPCSDLPDLTGRIYRVTEFVATAPTDGINPTWKKWADVYDLVMLFRILAHDRAAGRIEAVVACGGAELVPGPDGVSTPERLFFGLEPTSVHFTVDGCDLVIDEPLDIHLYTPWVSQEIPITEVTGDGSLAEDGSEIVHLSLSGFLGEATAAATCIDIAGLGVVNLHWFFNLAAICPDADADGDGVLEAYNFLGWIRAVDETPLFDDALTPIDSQVSECEIHDEECVSPSGG